MTARRPSRLVWLRASNSPTKGCPLVVAPCQSGSMFNTDKLSEICADLHEIEESLQAAIMPPGISQQDYRN